MTNEVSGREPLTAAQISVIEELMAERREQLIAEVQTLINAAVEQGVKFGDTVALKAHRGQFLCAEEGGPTEPEHPITFVSKGSVGAWETFVVNRGA